MNNFIREFRAIEKREEIQELINEFRTISRLRRDAYGRLVQANKEGQEPESVRATYLELTQYREKLLDKLAEFGVTVDRRGRVNFPW